MLTLQDTIASTNAILYILTLWALINSSAKHSAIVLMLRNEASLAPVHNNQIAWLTRLSGDTSTD